MKFAADRKFDFLVAENWYTVTRDEVMACEVHPLLFPPSYYSNTRYFLISFSSSLSFVFFFFRVERMFYVHTRTATEMPLWTPFPTSDLTKTSFCSGTSKLQEEVSSTNWPKT